MLVAFPNFRIMVIGAVKETLSIHYQLFASLLTSSEYRYPFPLHGMDLSMTQRIITSNIKPSNPITIIVIHMIS